MSDRIWVHTFRVGKRELYAIRRTKSELDFHMEVLGGEAKEYREIEPPKLISFDTENEQYESLSGEPKTKWDDPSC